MGNWHCVPDGCSEVVYQEYLSGKIRWRYGTDPWQEIIGADNFTTEVIPVLTQDTNYQAVYTEAIISGGQFQGWKSGEFYLNLGRRNGIQSYQYRHVYQGITYLQDAFSLWIVNPNAPLGQRTGSAWVDFKSQGTAITAGYASTSGVKWLRVEQQNPALRSSNCIFKVFKKEQVVYQETRSTCPQVEIIPCNLNPVSKKIEIKKTPYLEKIEVVPYQYSAYRLPGVPAPIVQADPIPPECLNIYNNSIYVVPPSGQGIYPNATPFDSLVAQICSYPGCPPPVYDVLCNSCGCESCPGDSCPVECNGVICCYNDYGVSIKEISLADYCGGQP
jgi:hypothetical protein